MENREKDLCRDSTATSQTEVGLVGNVLLEIFCEAYGYGAKQTNKENKRKETRPPTLFFHTTTGEESISRVPSLAISVFSRDVLER